MTETTGRSKLYIYSAFSYIWMFDENYKLDKVKDQ